MKFLDCPLKYIRQTGRTFKSYIKNTFMTLEATTVTLDTQTIY
jgi:hypothetical protein